MAILKDVGVTVVVGGKELTEYEAGGSRDDQPESPDTITRYVEATSGANFELRFEAKARSFDGHTALKFSAYLDGACMDNTVVYANRISTLQGVRSFEKGKWVIQNFRFTNLLLGEILSIVFILIKQERLTAPEDDAVPIAFPQIAVQRLKGLGFITIKVQRVTAIERVDNSIRKVPTVEKLKAIHPVPEKALKGSAVSHQTSFDKPTKCNRINTLVCQHLDSDDHPYATFNFKYRSRKALQAELIIPRSPSPVPLEDRPRETLTRKELLELLDRRRASVKPGVEAKDEASVRAGVKREHDPEFDEILASAHVRKVARTQQKVEVIDLLDD